VKNRLFYIFILILSATNLFAGRRVDGSNWRMFLCVYHCDEKRGNLSCENSVKPPILGAASNGFDIQVYLGGYFDYPPVPLFGKAAYLDGIDDNISTRDPNNLFGGNYSRYDTKFSGNGASYSITFWAYFVKIVANRDVLSNAGDIQCWRIYPPTGVYFSAYVMQAGGTIKTINTTVVAIAGRWYFFALVADVAKSEARFYIDGKKEGTVAMVGTRTAANQPSIDIGEWSQEEWLDEITFTWARAFTDNEALMIYENYQLALRENKNYEKRVKYADNYMYIDCWGRTLLFRFDNNSKKF